MTIPTSRAAFAFIVLFGLTTVAMGSAPGGTPETSFAGTWTLDPYVSDHPEQVAQALRIDTGGTEQGFAGEQEEEGKEGHASFGRNGTADAGRREGARTGRRTPLSATDQKLLSELTDPIRFAPTTLTITQTETAMSLSASATTSPDTLHPDGKAEKRQLKSGTVERTARWDGPRHLVVAYDVGRSSRLTYVYEVAPTTGQLVIRITFERRSGEPAPFEVKLVYNRVAGLSRPS